MNYFFLEPKNIFLSMSNTTQWKTINKGSKRNDDFKECSLIDLLTNKKTCYFCVMNKCKNQEHDRYDQNLKRLKYSFKDILYNPLNYSVEFKQTFLKATKSYMKKKFNITTSNFYVTNCTNTFLGRYCYNVRDDFHYDFQFEGKTFKACHKNPNGERGKVMICLHFDLHKRNNNVTLLPAKEHVHNEECKKIPKKSFNCEPKKEHIPNPKPEPKKEPEKTKEKNNSLWSNSLFKTDEEDKPKEKEDFKVKIEKKKPKSGNRWTTSLMDQKKINKETETKALISKLEEENLKLKEFITNAYDKKIAEIVSTPVDNTKKLEILCNEKQEKNSKLIKLWKKDFVEVY